MIQLTVPDDVLGQCRAGDLDGAGATSPYVGTALELSLADGITMWAAARVVTGLHGVLAVASDLDAEVVTPAHGRAMLRQVGGTGAQTPPFTKKARPSARR
jgi:hypothetical protein